MKVKITNAPVSFWYADKTGEFFEVEEHKIFDSWCVIGEQRNICEEDCEIVVEDGDKG